MPAVQHHHVRHFRVQRLIPAHWSPSDLKRLVSDDYPNQTVANYSACPCGQITGYHCIGVNHSSCRFIRLGDGKYCIPEESPTECPIHRNRSVASSNPYVLEFGPGTLQEEAGGQTNDSQDQHSQPTPPQNLDKNVTQIRLPDVNEVLAKLVEVEASFHGETKKIKDWVQEHRDYIGKNNRLIENKSDGNDIKILLSILRDLLVRAMTGEKGMEVFEQLQKSIRTKLDLNEKNYRRILERANYRWGVDSGQKVISGVVDLFKNKLDWEWKVYFDNAEEHHKTNFQDDELLRIKNIGFKVRDLSLSSFNSNYVANDLHVVRVMTRIGLLNYGFDLLKDASLEMGNNAANNKNYLFLHQLVLKLSGITHNKYTPADIDRIFWHFGKSVCGSKPRCNSCPVNDSCLTGLYGR